MKGRERKARTCHVNETETSIEQHFARVELKLETNSVVACLAHVSKGRSGEYSLFVIDNLVRTKVL